jgi:hypothetical protein
MFNTSFDRDLVMNLMLTATCDNTDAFYQSYLSMKPEFANWCDISRCAFGKIDDTNLVELFFDVDGPKLKAWLAKPSTQETFKKHNFVPTRYTFEPLQLG